MMIGIGMPISHRRIDRMKNLPLDKNEKLKGQIAGTSSRWRPPIVAA